MTLNREKAYLISKVVELIFKGELNYVQGCLQVGRTLKLVNPKHEDQVPVYTSWKYITYTKESLLLNLDRTKHY